MSDEDYSRWTGKPKINAPNEPYWTTPRISLLALSAISSGISAYHGYKRNDDSAGWGFGWGILGAIFPIITPVVAVAQGFGDPSSDTRIRHIEGALRPDIERQLGMAYRR